MNANITTRNVVMCPCCANTRHVIIRRRVCEDSRIENSCRCEKCSEEFRYLVDKYGSPQEK